VVNVPGDALLSSVPERMLSRGQAAIYLGVPVSTVYSWARSGRLRSSVTLGGHLRFSVADLDNAKTQPKRRVRVSMDRAVSLPGPDDAPLMADTIDHQLYAVRSPSEALASSEKSAN